MSQPFDGLRAVTEGGLDFGKMACRRPVGRHMIEGGLKQRPCALELVSGEVKPALLEIQPGEGQRRSVAVGGLGPPKSLGSLAQPAPLTEGNREGAKGEHVRPILSLSGADTYGLIDPTHRLENRGSGAPHGFAIRPCGVGIVEVPQSLGEQMEGGPGSSPEEEAGPPTLVRHHRLGDLERAFRVTRTPKELRADHEELGQFRTPLRPSGSVVEPLLERPQGVLQV